MQEYVPCAHTHTLIGQILLCAWGTHTLQNYAGWLHMALRPDSTIMCVHVYTCAIGSAALCVWKGGGHTAGVGKIFNGD